MVAFTQAVNGEEITLTLVTTTGTTLWEYAPFPLEWQLEWAVCD
jgi:hypothetical protein